MKVLFLFHNYLSLYIAACLIGNHEKYIYAAIAINKAKMKISHVAVRHWLYAIAYSRYSIWAKRND